MRLADPAYAESLIAAGVDEFEIALKGHDASTHDDLSQAPGSFQAARAAIAYLVEKQVGLILTILMTTRSYRFLPETIKMFAQLGVRRFHLWLISLHDMDKASLAQLLPKLSEVTPFVVQAMQLAEERQLEVNTSHIPPCLLPSQFRKNFVDVRALGLMVVSKSNRFMLEESPFEGGVLTAECLQCREKDRCLGLRSDYAEVYGEGEVQAIKETQNPSEVAGKRRSKWSK